MNHSDLNLLESHIIRLIGELERTLLWRQRATSPQVTGPTLSALESNIRGLKYSLLSSVALINLARSRVHLMGNGQPKTDSNGVTSQEDFQPIGGTVMIRTRPNTPEYEEGYDRIFKRCSHDFQPVIGDDHGHYGFMQCSKCGAIDNEARKINNEGS